MARSQFSIRYLRGFGPTLLIYQIAILLLILLNATPASAHALPLPSISGTNMDGRCFLPQPYAPDNGCQEAGINAAPRSIRIGTVPSTIFKMVASMAMTPRSAAYVMMKRTGNHSGIESKDPHAETIHTGDEAMEQQPQQFKNITTLLHRKANLEICPWYYYHYRSRSTNPVVSLLPHSDSKPRNSYICPLFEPCYEVSSSSSASRRLLLPSSMIFALLLDTTVLAKPSWEECHVDRETDLCEPVGVCAYRDGPGGLCLPIPGSGGMSQWGRVGQVVTVLGAGGAVVVAFLM